MPNSMDPLAMNIDGPTQLINSRVNKVQNGILGLDEGVSGEQEDVLTLKLDDDELLKLAKQWEAKYAGYEALISTRQKKNLEYYQGKQRAGSPSATYDQALASNLLFEAEETFLPAALSKNPEPVVFADNTDEGNQVSDAVKTMLQYHADQLVLRRKLTLMTRQWSIYFLGVMKHGWDEDIKDITTDVRKVQDFIFDPNGCVDVYGDFTSWLGERITVTGEKLIDMFPTYATYIEEITEGKLGTDVTFTEWWTDEFCFVTFKDKVLDKHKNEFFNYDKESTDQFGLPETVKGHNHFAKPKKPYTFLSVFSLGEQPHDITGLIEQNIPNQNLVSKRTYQIDQNISRENNSVAFSENNFNGETAKQAATAFEKGHPVLVPSGGPISEAIVRFPAEGLPDSIFKDLENNMNNLRTIFGTQGITAQQPNDETTARGMILNQQYDNTRIGGGIGDAIAQVADNVFNWWVQLYYKYYDEPHFAAVLGNLKSVEYVHLQAGDFNRRIIVSVAPDSMKPKDEITVANQAIQLFDMKVIGPKTLLTLLNFPDPDESAADGVMYAIDPMSYLKMNWPDYAAKLQAAQQEQMQIEQQMQMANGQQQLQQGAAQGEQQLGQKQAAHEQKMTHTQQAHEQKLALQVPPTTGGANENPSLKQVKLPK